MKCKSENPADIDMLAGLLPMAARDRLADALDLPVLTSNQAALHAALDLLGATATA